ncbi:TetR/AcrR family transcriptional regulator, partial [Mesorhizobium xinjiangense]|uniref:TetR/AcrR family transcriptional regulator n=1 Tax=Mesorhizobium xinjiangense TaxID=2678685 RepID=UPI0012EE8045
MQENSTRRSNTERTRATRAGLLSAARQLFVAKGYAETGTPEIVAAAKVTRGALYHHFADKQALFRAVVEQESAAVAGEIEQAAPASMPPLEALIAGGAAFIRAMRVDGRTRLLLLDGPAVLGRAELDRIDLEMGGLGSLRDGLAAAMRAGALPAVPLGALAALLSAA